MGVERVCDRCGSRTANPTKWKALFIGRRLIGILGSGRVMDEDLGDLCPSCLASLKRWAKAPEPDPS